VDNLEPLAGKEKKHLLYIRDVGLIVAGPGLSTHPNAIETPTMRKRRKDRMKGRLEPLRDKLASMDVSFTPEQLRALSEASALQSAPFFTDGLKRVVFGGANVKGWW